MKQVAATVISNEKLWGKVWLRGRLKYSASRLMWLKCPEIAQEANPGQFVMASCGKECILPRPLSIHQRDGGKIALLFQVVGKGTQWLSQRQAGDAVELFGPLGNGYSIHPASHNLLLVAGGVGIAPLYFLEQEALKKEYSVTLLYGTADKKRLSTSPQIKLVSATEDGTVGHRGKVTDLLSEFVGWADQVFACGPSPMYRAMAKMPELKQKLVQISLEVGMGCGLGACYGCTVRIKAGLKQVCRDGPVFNLDDILWDELVDV